MSSHVKPCRPGVTEDIAEILTLPLQPVQDIFLAFSEKTIWLTLYFITISFHFLNFAGFFVEKKGFLVLLV